MFSLHFGSGRLNLIAAVVGILINLSNVDVGGALNLSEDNRSEGQHVLVRELVALEIVSVVRSKAIILGVIAEEILYRVLARAFKGNVGRLL